MITVLDGTRFHVVDAHGDAGSGSEGLYADDTRVLRRWQLEVDGRRPTLLGGGEDGSHTRWAVHGAVAGPDRDAPPVLITRRRIRVSGAGLRETLSVTNHGPAARVAVRYGFAPDFADLLEVKRRELGKPDLVFARDLPPVSVEGGWCADVGVHRWRATAGPWTAAVEVSFSRRGEPGPDGVTFAVDVGAGETWEVEARVLLGDGTAVDALVRAEDATADRVRRWLAALPVLETPDAALAATCRRSLADLAALRMPVDGGGLLPAAGLPWFVAVFGRDVLITCLLTLAFDPDAARTALRVLGGLQATADDPSRDAEPGKIPHELRSGRVAALSPALPYYGTVDATPLYVMLAVETWRWTGDDALLRELEPNLRAAMAWIAGADLTGRGYVEFRRRSEHGLDVQSWKDSRRSMLFADGTPAVAPLAVCEVQGYAYAAGRGLADVARHVWDDAEYADRLDRDARSLRDRFDRDFWVSARGHHALALDADGRPVDALTSDVGHLLWTGIATGHHADRTADALLGPQLFSGWGVRTMATGDRGFHPVGHHVGTVWPHDTALACLGLARHGRTAEAHVVLRGLVDAAVHLDGRLPEELTGFARAETPFPLRFPSSSAPQAWAAAAPLGALVAVLGLAPDRATGTLTAPGPVPVDLDVALRGVPALGRRWDVVARDGRVAVAAH